MVGLPIASATTMIAAHVSNPSQNWLPALCLLWLAYATTIRDFDRA